VHASHGTDPGRHCVFAKFLDPPALSLKTACSLTGSCLFGVFMILGIGKAAPYLEARRISRANFLESSARCTDSSYVELAKVQNNLGLCSAKCKNAWDVHEKPIINADGGPRAGGRHSPVAETHFNDCYSHGVLRKDQFLHILLSRGEFQGLRTQGSGGFAAGTLKLRGGDGFDKGSKRGKPRSRKRKYWTGKARRDDNHDNGKGDSSMRHERKRPTAMKIEHDGLHSDDDHAGPSKKTTASEHKPRECALCLLCAGDASALASVCMHVI
jgi:hypothetical protein